MPEGDYEGTSDIPHLGPIGGRKDEDSAFRGAVGHSAPGRPPLDETFLGFPKLGAVPTDADRASLMRQDILAHLDVIAEIMNKADRDNFVIAFSMNRDQYGRFRPQLDILKRLA